MTRETIGAPIGIGKALLFAIPSAPLFVLSFPPFHLGFLAWVGLVPLLTVLRRMRPGPAFLTAYGVAIPFLMGVFYWINVIKGFSWVDFVLLGLYLGAYYAIFGGLFALANTKTRCPAVLSAPALWTSMEYLRSHAGFLSLPWALLGHSQYDFLPAIQVATAGGAYAVSFLVVMVNMAVAETVSTLWERRGAVPDAGPRFPIPMASMLAFLAFGIALAHGTHAASVSPPPRAITVSVIQGNIPQGIKWDPAFRNSALEKHLSLTDRVSAETATDLVAWPETAIPSALNADPFIRSRLSALAKERRIHILVGSAMRAKIAGKGVTGRGPSRNSAFLIAPTGAIVGVYDKIRLFPFGEYLPLQGVFPWPERIARSAGAFLPGREPTLLNLSGIPFAAPICWETIFPELFRRFVGRGALFAVNITNEAWFGETAAPEQFLSMNVFRAVENRISVVRAANTGISCFIDPTGKVLGRVSAGGKDIFVEGALTREIPLRQVTTFYTRYGDVFAWVCLSGGAILAGISAWHAVADRRVPEGRRA